MYIFLTFIQGVSVILLTLVGLVSTTFNRNSQKLTVTGWVLVICASIIFLFTTITKEINVSNTNDMLFQQTKTIEEIRKKLFDALAPKVMEAPKEIFPVPVQKPTGQLQITSPKDGTKASARTLIKGTVADLNAKVWVIVHPVDKAAYWVQPTISVRKDGNWSVMGYLGRLSSIDKGKQFEIMAIANPKKELTEGDVLSGWPDAHLRSHVIALTVD